MLINIYSLLRTHCSIFKITCGSSNFDISVKIRSRSPKLINSPPSPNNVSIRVGTDLEKSLNLTLFLVNSWNWKIGAFVLKFCKIALENVDWSWKIENNSLDLWNFACLQSYSRKLPSFGTSLVNLVYNFSLFLIHCLISLISANLVLQESGGDYSNEMAVLFVK